MELYQLNLILVKTIAFEKLKELNYALTIALAIKCGLTKLMYIKLIIIPGVPKRSSTL